MQHPLLRILPVPETLGARLAMFLLVLMLTSLVLFVLTALDMAGLAPVYLEETFTWVVLSACFLLLLLGTALWRTIAREVLRPLEQIEKELRPEEHSGLNHVAATMRELREEVSRTQAALDKSAVSLRHVEKLAMVGQLAAGVAHSVRNPLTSVKLRLFSLERGLTPDARQQEDFAVIADAIRHVDGIVSNFLEFSKRPGLKLERISPSAVVDASLALLENRLAVFPVSLTLHREQSLPEVQADPEQLREAMLNILLNACEAMQYSGNLVVEETLVSRGNSHLHAAIRIADSGPGIAAEQLPDIFTPFFSTKEQGTGLGLPIAKSILEEHYGDIEVESSARTGTAFTLLIPLTEAHPGNSASVPGTGRRRSRLRADIAAPE
ncbi:MAG: ATP-binding protein [Desulfovibrionaceae bacterium]|nr:ATP-binding protein [Desulfovibrionaceae bacterium]